MNSLDGVRRIITGHDETGKAVVLLDDIDRNKIARPTGVVNRLIWMTSAVPADISDMSDMSDRAVENGDYAPPRGGATFRIVDFPSRTEAELAALPSDLVARQFGNDETKAGHRPPSHPLMHRTRTLDFAAVLCGEIDMLLDDGKVLTLHAGNVFVQRGTNHAWINRSGGVCRIAFVFVDANEPLTYSQT